MRRSGARPTVCRFEDAPRTGRLIFRWTEAKVTRNIAQYLLNRYAHLAPHTVPGAPRTSHATDSFLLRLADRLIRLNRNQFVGRDCRGSQISVGPCATSIRRVQADLWSRRGCWIRRDRRMGNFRMSVLPNDRQKSEMYTRTLAH